MWMASLDDLFVSRGWRGVGSARDNDGQLGNFNFPALRFVVLSRFRPSGRVGAERESCDGWYEYAPGIDMDCSPLESSSSAGAARGASAPRGRAQEVPRLLHTLAGGLNSSVAGIVWGTWKRRDRGYPKCTS